MMEAIRECKCAEVGGAVCSVCGRGVWQVRTESGSAYLIDFDAMTQTRMPDPERLDSPAIGGVEAKSLRKDSQQVGLFQVESIVVGRPMVLTLAPLHEEAFWTTRRTTYIESVAKLE